jgi:outer membrane lipoprotein-sorting protein
MRFLLIAAVLFLSACKGHEKKVLVYASDKIDVDNTQRHITIANGDGTTHHEQELDFTGGDPVTLDVESPQGKYSVTISGDGLYIANLKTDTVVGSRQHVGAEGGESRITQDLLKKKIDSLQQLALDQNVSEANQNYFIAPRQAVRLTAETKAKVFGPFTTIPGGFDAGSVPAIYKFYSMKEMREIIARLQQMSGGPDSSASKK